MSSRRQIFSWALYDWANSAFATTVLAGFFPLFFKQYWSSGVAVTQSTFRLGLLNALTSLLIALCAPFIGAYADESGKRKSMLFFFTLIGCLASSTLALVPMGQWWTASFVFAFAVFGFNGSGILYDSLLVPITTKDQRNFVSAAGYALGYLGGGLLFALQVGMTLKPQLFGLSSATVAIKLSFVMVGLWWIAFSIPLFLFVKERRDDRPQRAFSQLLATTLRKVFETLKRLKHQKTILTFLLAYWFYIDGVSTVVRMAVDYGMALGLESSHLIGALLITQFVGFPAALVLGWLAKRLGSRTTLLVCIAGYLGISVFAYFIQSEAQFYLLAFAVGLFQGGLQAVSRAYYSCLVPSERAGEYFGLYQIWGRFAAIIGPLLMGVVALVTANPRNAVFVLFLLFLSGGALLLRCPPDPTKVN